MTKKQLENFKKKILLLRDDGCWYWKGHLDKTGYGRFRFGRLVVLAHRLSYHIQNLDFPVSQSEKKEQLNHKCRNRGCVNPDHLEITSNRENVLKGKSSKLKPNKSSKYPDVYWIKRDKKWQARICLGYFNSEEEAYETVKHHYERYMGNVA